MIEGEQGQLSNVPQNGKAHRQKYWGMGLAVLGFILEFMVTNFVHATAMVTLGLIVAVGICAIGIGYYSKARGNTIAWGGVGLVPFLGFLLFLFLFPLVTGFRKNWVGFVFSIIVMGILVAIIIPNFMHYGAQPSWWEAKVDLGGLFTTAIAYKAEHKTFVISDIHQLRYSQVGSPRYTLWYAVNGVPTRINVVTPDRARGCDGPPTLAQVATSATGFTAVARGNIGGSTCDEWSIDDARVLTHMINDTDN